MSFRLADLKKSVRKGRQGHQVTVTRLEGRRDAFRVEFLLQQFEGHLGRPRRELDPEALIDFVGDTRLGRGLLATLSQWYRLRPRTFAELLEDGGARLRTHEIEGPVDLRAWLYAAANRDGAGYLEPEAAPTFWQSQGRRLSIRPERLPRLTELDRPEEAVLVRTGPPPSAADVMAAYNARAHTTLLRSAAEVTLRFAAPREQAERAAEAWAAPLDVEWRADNGALHLFGRPDALGCWTRHGRRLERAVMELLVLSDPSLQELEGRLTLGERECRFRWQSDVLAMLGAGRGDAPDGAGPAQIEAFAAALRRERDRAGGPSWSIRRASHTIAVEGAACLPHLELRHGDLSLYVRLAASAAESEALAPFRHRTAVAAIAVPKDGEEPLAVRFAGEPPRECTHDQILSVLAVRLEELREATSTRGPGQRMRAAA